MKQYALHMNCYRLNPCFLASFQENNRKNLPEQLTFLMIIFGFFKVAEQPATLPAFSLNKQ